jgi:Secretion system C-terminal sorting domain
MATTRMWNGGTSGAWSVAANWIPAGVPSNTDSVIFDGNITPLVSLNSFPAGRFTFLQLSILNNATVTLTASASVEVGFDRGIFIEAGARLNLGGLSTTKFQVNLAASGPSLVAGILDLQGRGNSLNPVELNFLSPGTPPVTTITGSVIFSGNNALITHSGSTHLVFESGSLLEISRDGGNVQAANYKTGSTIRITGVKTSPTQFSVAGSYLGLIEWNCPAQPASFSGGAVAAITTGSNTVLGDIKITHTGLGQVRLATNPVSTAIRSITVDNGTFEIASPASIAMVRVTGHVTLNNGKLLVNANPVPAVTETIAGTVQLRIGGNLLLNGGVLDMSNRLVNGTGANGQIFLAGNLVQTGGLITETTPYTGRGGDMEFEGTTQQQVAITNISNHIGLKVNNPAGIRLNADLSCPELCKVQQGIIDIGNFQLTVQNNLLEQAAGPDVYTNAFIITSGSGELKLTNKTGKDSMIFPIAREQGQYNPLKLKNLQGLDYGVRVQVGVASPGGIFSPSRTVNRMWWINSTGTLTGPVQVYFSYTDADKNPGCTPSNPMQLGHYLGGVWNLESPFGGHLPTGTPAAREVGPFLVSTFSPFVIGNLGSILSINTFREFYATKVNDEVQTTWSLNSTDNVRFFELERSANSTSFNTLATINFTMGTLRYSYTDRNLLPGVNYYRLKITGRDDIVTYSRIVAIINTKSGFAIAALIPNPVQHDIVLSVAASNKSIIGISICDMSGRMLKVIKHGLQNGSNEIRIPVRDLPSGIYQLTAIVLGEEPKVVRFMK